MKVVMKLALLFGNALAAVASYFTEFIVGTSTPFNTTISNALSADGLTWSQAYPIQRDKYGNVIVNMQRNTGGRRVWIFSNDDGVTWQDNTGVNDFGTIGEIATRHAFVYDAANDCLHGLLYYNNEVVVYRRYTIVYSGTNISSIDWTRGVSPNTVLHSVSSTDFEHPVIRLFGDTLIAVWGNTGSTGADVIAVRCDISSDVDAGASASNWVHIGVNSSTTTGSAPDTASYTVIKTHTALINMYPSVLLEENGDLVFIYLRRQVATDSYYILKVPYSGGSWSIGTETLLSNKRVSGTDSGYGFKEQLTTLPISYNDCIYVCCALWAGGLGDSVKLFKITADNVVTSVYVYQAGGEHTYAPTSDIALIDTRLVMTYLTDVLSTEIVAHDPDDLSVVVSPTLVVPWDEDQADIPLLAQEKINNKLLCMFRIIGSPPQVGKFITIDLV